MMNVRPDGKVARYVQISNGCALGATNDGGMDWIDLYQIHRPEDDTDIDETLVRPSVR
jgi:hypothetical protein